MPHNDGSPDRFVSSDAHGTPDRIIHLDGPVGGSGVTIADEGVVEGDATTINFTGAGVSVTFAAGTATVTISGGGAGGSADFLGIEKWSIT